MNMPSKPAKAGIEDFIKAGGTQPTTLATPTPADEKEMSGFSLRLYTTMLRKLAEIRDTRRAEAKANKRRNASAISVHSLVLEGIDLLLKQETKRSKLAAVGSTKGNTTKPTTGKTANDTNK